MRIGARAPRPAPVPDRPVAARRARVRRRRPRVHRDAVRRRQRLHRDARQPRGGSRRPQPRHVPQRLPRDVAHPPRRGGLRLRQDGPDDRQRPRRQADEAVRRRRAAAVARTPTSRSTSGSLDFRDGVLTRDLVWRTPAGKRVRVRSQRLVSLAHRHLAMLTFEVTLLDGSAPIVVSSQMLNRQDGEDEYHVAAARPRQGLRSAPDAAVRPPRARSRASIASATARSSSATGAPTAR